VWLSLQVPRLLVMSWQPLLAFKDKRASWHRFVIACVSSCKMAWAFSLRILLALPLVLHALVEMRTRACDCQLFVI
jgi:hypothetical protein